MRAICASNLCEHCGHRIMCVLFFVQAHSFSIFAICKDGSVQMSRRFREGRCHEGQGRRQPQGRDLSGCCVGCPQNCFEHCLHSGCLCACPFDSFPHMRVSCSAFFCMCLLALCAVARACYVSVSDFLPPDSGACLVGSACILWKHLMQAILRAHFG